MMNINFYCTTFIFSLEDLCKLYRATYDSLILGIEHDLYAWSSLIAKPHWLDEIC